MSETICPDCGHANPPGAETCESCNYPLRGVPLAPAAGASVPASVTPPAAMPPAPPAPAPPPPASAPPSPVPAEEPFVVPRTLRRPMRRAAPLPGQSVSLWLFFGAVAAVILIWTAIDANRQRQVETTPVAGSNDVQQKAAEAAQAALAKDSSDVEAHIALGNVLYDTANWDGAIVHYRAALRRDSTRVPVIVDLGVCYYNLGDTPEAEQLFHQALSKDPNHPVALYNMGIVNERRERWADALAFYHRALENSPSDDARTEIAEAVTRMEQKTGKRPAPLPAGASKPSSLPKGASPP